MVNVVTVEYIFPLRVVRGAEVSAFVLFSSFLGTTLSLAICGSDLSVIYEVRYGFIREFQWVQQIYWPSKY